MPPISRSVPAKPLGSLPPLPPLAKNVLEALRTPDRPVLPARPPDPPDAKERARRIAMPVDVRLVLASGARGEGVSRDVSTTGLFIVTSSPLAVGDELGLELLLPGKEAFVEQEFRVRARVVRQDARGFGLQLIAPEAALRDALDAL